MPRKRRPFAPLAPLTPFALLLPQIKLNFTNIASLSASTLRPFKSLTLTSTLTPCFEIDVPKSKKAKIKKLEIKLTPLPLPLTKTISYSIKFCIYLNIVKSITQAFLINFPISVRKTS